MKIGNGEFWIGDCLELMKDIPDGVVDLTVTSPPYDNLREYGKDDEWTFDKFVGIASELVRITKQGGVIVWNVADATINYSETLTSFKQALYFKEQCNLKIHDTMLYAKSGFSNPSTTRYHQCFEYVFIISKGRPTTFNPIKDKPNKYVGTLGRSNTGGKCTREEFGMRSNLWEYSTGKNQTERHNSSAFKHPAPMHIKLARDHILSWSNEGDLVFDPFGGSGTTSAVCEKLNRKWISCEINEDYASKAIERIRSEVDRIETQLFS